MPQIKYLPLLTAVLILVLIFLCFVWGANLNGTFKKEFEPERSVIDSPKIKQ